MEDVAGDIEGQLGVIAANAIRRQEGVDQPEDGGDAGPAEQQVDDAEPVAPEIEVMRAEAAEEDGEEDADDLVFAGALILGIEEGALGIVHVAGVNGVRELHVVSGFLFGLADDHTRKGAAWFRDDPGGICSSA